MRRAVKTDIAERRVRTGRLSLPRSVAELTVHQESALAGVNAFVDGLAALPFTEWLRIGRLIATDRVAHAARSCAWPILDATIGAAGLRVTAWYVRDAVDTSAFIASAWVRRWSSAERWAFSAAHGAAEDAGLAVLTRPDLSEEDFAIFYAPFATAVSIKTVLRIASSALDSFTFD